jgi:formylglycine-generating enzyme required for sulfatase activity
MTNCGSGSESCCTSLQVAGGTYYRTYTNSGSGPTGLADPATVSSFRLDKYLVTVGRFRQFVNAWNGGAGWLPPAGSGKHAYLSGSNGLNAVGGGYEPGWIAMDNSNVAPTNDNLLRCAPYSTWTAFCIWDGGAFLPSEAEWGYAAAGGNQQREYPWGSTTPGTANQYAIYGDGAGNCYYPSGSGSCASVANIAAVGTATLGAGLWGHLDLAGDLMEWNVDWHGTYAACTDCADFTSGSNRVIRGGLFSNGQSYLLPPSRFFNPPAIVENYIGFRCARSP